MILIITQDDQVNQSYHYDQYGPYVTHDQDYQDDQGDKDDQIPPSTGVKKGLFQCR